MLRKRVAPVETVPPANRTNDIDIARVATVVVSSEHPAYPVDHALDGSLAPGGRRWVAGGPGEQAITLVFDAPQTLKRVSIQVEETETARTQEICLSASWDGGVSFRELLRQEFTFSPPGTTIEREDWAVRLEGITHLRLMIRPDKGHKSCLATLTSLAIE